MIQNLTIVVVDDHPILLKGLIDELKSYDYNVVAEAENGAQALDRIIDLKPSIAILDIELPLLSGFEIIQKCQEESPNTKFIILTSFKEKSFVLKAQKLNISGYILKDEPFIELHNCIQKVSKGESYFSKSFNEILTNEIAPEIEKMKFLSPSERTIVRMVASGKTSKEIGESLSISNRTVEKHRSNIINKLDLPHQGDALVVWAKEHKELILSI
ncbi:response regulator [Ekhidna sp.]